MNRDDSSGIGPGFEYVIQCFDALNKSRYSDALRLLDDGLNQHLLNPEEVDIKALLKHVSALINYLEFRLEEDKNVPSEEPIDKDELNPETRCSFCGDRQSENKEIIAGPGVNICDECVRQCSDAFAAKSRSHESS